MNKHRRSALMVLLTLCCLMSAYGFYKMNPHDTFNAVIFGIGLLGIMMSVARNTK